MKVHHDLNDLPVFTNAVLTIGSFDGVHKGHCKIIEKLRSLAEAVSGESVVITFHPHPRLVLQGKSSKLKLLNSLSEKVDRFAALDIDHLVVVPFNLAFANQSPQEYIDNFIQAKFNPRHLVIGYDHQFGKNRAGNIEMLLEYAQGKSLEITQIEKEEVKEIGVSSSKIRKAIAEGDLKLANELLTQNYSLKGKVISGHKIGASLGFPTANIEPEGDHKLIPRVGIYAVKVKMDEALLPGMMYIGDRPSIEHLSDQTLEVNIFDFEGDIYGKEIEIIFEKFIRDDQKFADMDSLSSAIANDEKVIRKFYGIEKENTTANSNEHPEAAIVILNYNGSTHLQEYLPSIKTTSYPNARIIVVDNCSTDDSAQVVMDKFPDVELIVLEANFGFTGGYARALKMIDTEYIVLMNSDVRVEPNWLDEAMKVMLADRRIAVVQPKILSDKRQTHFEYAGAAGGWMDKWGYPFCKGRIFDVLEKDELQYKEEDYIFWASGCAFLMRNKAYQDSGGLDMQYFAHLEEIDLCWRLQRMGYFIKYAPKSVVYHLGGGTLSYQSPRKTFLNFRNSLFTVFKNKKGLALWSNIIMRLILDGVAGVKFLFSLKPADTWAIIRAHFSFYGHIGKLISRKKKEQEWIDKNKVADTKVIHGAYKKSIVFQHYILGKNKFTEL